jgi:predicted NAD/FAD-binding protein
MPSPKIAIIGSGISGLTCAHLLSKNHDVTLFEANDYIGGHTHTVPVTVDGESFMIDTGFIVCNDRNYPNFLKLMAKLKVEIKPTEMSFSVRNPSLKLEYNGHNLNTLFSQRLNLFRPSFHRLVKDIVRFNAASKAALESGQIDDISLDEFVAQHAFDKGFKENYLLPMVAAIWSCSLSQAGAFPLAFFLRFFLNHGLLDIKNRPQWYVLSKGSSSYIKPMSAGFSDRIKLNSPVSRVTRTESGVELEVAGSVQHFDEVILACHSDQALAMRSDPSPEETEILGAIGYQANDVTLHMDASIMPKKSLSWASWNFLAGQSHLDEAPIVTYCMNILQGIHSTRPFLVTLNAKHKIDPEKILQQFRYDHPVYSQESIIAQGRRSEICGTQRIHYCGAYWYSGFHEDGVRSALDVCARFGEGL